MAGTLLYGRACKLTIAPPIKGNLRNVQMQSAIVIEQLRVKFKIVKSLRKEPNNGEIFVYNLADNTRKQIQGKGCRVWLEAGYTGTMAGIFQGDVRYVDSHKDDKRGSCDWETKLELGDGERAFAYGRVNVSRKAGTKRADVLKDIATQSGWDLGNVPQFYASLQDQYVNGFAAYGSAAEALDAVLKARGLRWSIQNGAIQILPLAGYTPAAAIQLDVNHGLIGSPEMGSEEHKKAAHKRTLKVKSLLQPLFVPGGRINLVSVSHNGVYTIQKVHHEGDTHGNGDNSWTSEIEVVPA